MTELDKIKDVDAELPSTIPTMFSTFEQIQRIDFLLADIKNNINRISEGKGREDASYSGTYSAETTHLYLKLLKKYEKFSNETCMLTYAIVEQFSGTIKSNMQSPDEMMTVFYDARKEYHKTEFTVNLYARITQMIIDALWHDDRTKTYQIMQEIEEDKDRALMQKLPKKSTTKNTPPLRTFGLMGIMKTTSLKKILTNEFDAAASVSKLDTFARKHKTCIVLIHKVTNNPLEFYIDPLINEQIAKVNSHPKDTGVNPSYIRKMSTIHRGSPTKWKFGTQIFGDVNSATYVILETLDGENYRPVAPWTRHMSAKIPRHYILGFIRHLEGGSRRIESYNMLMSTQIVDKMFFPKAINISDLSKESKEIDPKYLRNDAFITLMLVYDKIAKKVSTPDAFERVIFGDELVDELSNFLITYYKNFKKHIFHNFRYAELVVDFLAELQYIHRAFTQEMYDQYAEHRIDPAVYKSKHRKADLRDIFEEILQAVLQSIITDTKNVYQAMSFKNKLFTLR